MRFNLRVKRNEIGLRSVKIVIVDLEPLKITSLCDKLNMLHRFLDKKLKVFVLEMLKYENQKIQLACYYLIWFEKMLHLNL